MKTTASTSLRAFAMSTLVAASIFVMRAQNNADIVDHITADGVNTIVQPEALRKLIARQQTESADSNKAAADEAVETTEHSAATRTKTAGFRVQVFSDNNQRTAKNEARTKARIIGERFPELRTYVTYTSPYWRLKVGDFRTQRDAQAAADDIRQAFPSYGKEIRVVRDRVNL
ncbi:SPOR domain-containing protein [Paramuribaculum intestinale]|uniref:SPOR domain-containing protein n=1 Tax=Paramuribaculum intestinale TaxID=2094151 RepID=UPI0025AEE829|nr:SPOR domain-containing protein [Paramuribaculum intestinale]